VIVAPERRPSLHLLVAVLAVYLVLAGWTAFAEYVWSNEAWFASPALTLIHKGYLGTTILESKGTWLEGIDRHTYWIPPLHPLMQALWYRLFGFSLLALRWLSIAAGAALLLAWYSMVSRLAESRWIALLAIAITATDARFLTFAELGRADAMCAALGALGLAIYLHWRERFLLRAILAGNALAAASCLTHPCGVLYAAGLLLLAIYYDRRRIGWRALACIGLPYIAALSAWGAYILQAPSQFKTQLLGNIGGIGREFTGLNRLSGLTSPLQALKRELFLRYGYTFGRYATDFADRVALFALLIYVLAVAGCLLTPSIRRHRGYRALLLVGALDYLVLGIFDGFKSSGYVVHTMPLAGAFLAIYAHFLLSRAKRPALAIALAAVMILFGAVQLNAICRNLFVTPQRWDYENAVAFLRHAGAPSGIIAAGEFAFALGFDSAMVDDIRLGYFSGRRPPFIVASSIYRGWLQQSAVLDPAIHHHMVQLLRDEYRVAFQNSTYTIYQRLPQPLEP
jgi:4-amino-4-deoxy-L-arabinose transferase-like glycosyltransferase